MTLKKTILIALGLVLICLAARVVWAANVVSRVAATVVRSTEIGFGPLGQADCLGGWVYRRVALPSWLHGATFDVAFRPVAEFELYYPEGLRGDLGAELLRFSDLRRVTIDANDDYEPTESDWTLLCTRLRALPHLTELEIAGMHITDAAIKPLSKHPKLRVLAISQSRLTSASIETFSSLPKLTWLQLETIGQDEAAWLKTSNDQTAVKEALRGVKIALP